MELIHIAFSGPVVKLKVNERFHTFEMHRHLGPMKLKSDGETPAKNYWSEDSDFWPVFNAWLEQGQRVDENRLGIVD